MATPTIQRRRLGAALRRAREQAAKTQEEAAAVLDAASSKVSRLEQGQSGIKLTDLQLLLNLYGVNEGQATSLRELARAGKQRGRWSGHRHVVPDWFRSYMDLEADASEIRWYQAEIVPGLLQTEHYMQAIHAGARPEASVEERDNHVKVRMERAAILDTPQAPSLKFILSESALRRNVGGAHVQREQLQYLVEVSQRPNIELQVYPFVAQTYEPATFGFTILRFDDDPHSDVIYIEDYTDADYLDRPESVQAHLNLWARLRAAAWGSVESRELIRNIAAET